MKLVARAFDRPSAIQHPAAKVTFARALDVDGLVTAVLKGGYPCEFVVFDKRGHEAADRAVAGRLAATFSCK